MEIKAGDYLLTKENQLFRIIDIHYDVKGTFYDIKTVRSVDNSDTYNYGQHAVWLNTEMPKTIRSVPRNVLRHMGKIIPEEKVTKTLKILYG